MNRRPRFDNPNIDDIQQLFWNIGTWIKDHYPMNEVPVEMKAELYGLQHTAAKLAERAQKFIETLPDEED